MAGSERRRRWRLHSAVPAYDCPTPLTVANHIAGAFTNATSRHAVLQDRTMSPLLQSRAKLLIEVIVFILAMKRMFDQLAAIFEQIRAKLPAST